MLRSSDIVWSIATHVSAFPVVSVAIPEQSLADCGIPVVMPGIAENRAIGSLESFGKTSYYLARIIGVTNGNVPERKLESACGPSRIRV